MATVPEPSYDGPAEHGVAAEPRALPPRSAFGGEVGAEVRGVGAEVGRVAQEERIKAATVQATRAETEYMQRLSETVYDVEHGFASLHGDAALKQLAVTKAKISSLREEIGAGLGSRHAQTLYANNSLKHTYYALEFVDRYAGTQRRMIVNQEYRKNLFELQQHVTGAAVVGNVEQADSLIKQAQRKGYERAAGMNLEQHEADQLAEEAVAHTVDAYLGTLSKLHPDLARTETDKWGQHASPGKIGTVMQTIETKEGRETLQRMLDAAPRVDLTGGGHPDDDGLIDWSAVRDAIHKLPPEKRTPVLTAFRQAREEEEDTFKDVVKQRKMRVMAQGSDNTGMFRGIDAVKSADDVAWLQRNDPSAVADLRKTALSLSDAADRRTDHTRREASNKALTAWYGAVAHMSDDTLINSRRQDIMDDLSKYFNDLNKQDLRTAMGAFEHFQKLSSGKLPFKINSYVEDALKAAYPRDAGLRNTKRDGLTRMLMEGLVNQTVNKNDKEIRDFLRGAVNQHDWPGHFSQTTDLDIYERQRDTGDEE